VNSIVSRSYIKHSYFPLYLDISNKLCIVLGGGKVAERKTLALLKYNARVRVISPNITRRLSELASECKIEVRTRDYRSGDLRGATLVFAATSNKKINKNIKEESEKKGIQVNVVDNPDLCTFIVPSVIKKDDIQIAISTSGRLPLLSKKLRKDISRYITNDYLRYLKILGNFRRYLLKNIQDAGKRNKIMRKISRMDVKEIIRMNSKELKERFL